MRKQKHPILWNWGKRRGRVWTDSDVECARFLRHCDLTNKDIGEILKRSTASIDAKIGYVGQQPYVSSTAFYESARAVIGRTWGDAADNFQTIGNA